ncbi:MAG: hypothetical protein CM15mP129_02640 [Chloroflexota bacterium]|nr:MAG: hypothetical protein CM15mP129_02640 [Chloroflexota bacterium]
MKKLVCLIGCFQCYSSTPIIVSQEEVDSLVQEVDSIAQSEVLESTDDIVEEQLVVEEEELNFHQELKKRFMREDLVLWE